MILLGHETKPAKVWPHLPLQIHKNPHPQNLGRGWSIFRGARLQVHAHNGVNRVPAKWFEDAHLEATMAMRIASKMSRDSMQD